MEGGWIETVFARACGLVGGKSRGARSFAAAEMKRFKDRAVNRSHLSLDDAIRFNQEARVSSPIKIDLSEEFPHLPNAPIVEAVIEIQARATTEWEEKRVTALTAELLKDYPKQQSQQRFQTSLKFDTSCEPGEAHQNISPPSFMGVTCHTDDEFQYGRFNRDSFVFGHLRPYPDWGRFLREAMRLWGLHCSIAEPTLVQRLGLRFINQIPLPPEKTDLDLYLNDGPQTPRGLDVVYANFFHSDIMVATGHPYRINLVRTIQPSAGDLSRPALVVDIDVSTTETSPVEDNEIYQRLGEMRWLKNKAFFGTLTESTIATFK
jgi:uncharacterized protein (TIGR04255 family)